MLCSSKQSGFSAIKPKLKIRLTVGIVTTKEGMEITNNQMD
ncbi:hypothetical protein CIT292_09816 [Citrobacter youngae ATCC 29220]|uniref:Uncharacterized protein n=1 Tax=Citrobacter youngae ATCC 29220 TaxID=500640 RepID=D4BH09_9ENTR|nr:hypothetical protein CIT292_09816 [Citrobacter youngae ATCC 29220]